ncbi:hypothetical protein LBMAG49_09470 [Planctomycetota bacterium]|nr:hypothetical protein LBMAG49_09470 [Planctomycetota bacterium]
MRFLAAIPFWVVLLVLLGGAIAVSTFEVGFLSDDFLMVRYWDRQSSAVHWDRVALDCQGPWFHVRDLYRPVVSLSCVLQLLLHGFDARWFHLANAAMVTTAALAIGALVRMRFPQGNGLLAFAAGAVLLVHPSVVEPSHWIMARTTALEVMFSALTLLFYGAFLHGKLRSRWPAFVAMVLALGSKEGALLLPVSLVAVDVLHSRGTLMARVQGLRPFFVLLFAALLFRKLALGVFTTGKEALAPSAVISGIGRHVTWLLGPDGASWWVALSLAIVLLVPWAWQRPKLFVAFCAWGGCLLLPASHVPSVLGTYDGRLIYSLMPMLGILLAEATSVSRVPRLGALALGLLLSLFAAITYSLAADYRTGGAAVTAAQQKLGAAALGCAIGSPIAPIMVSLPNLRLQLLQTKLWGLMGQRPFAEKDLAITSLESVLPRGNVIGTDAVDATPAHAVLEAGGMLASFDGTKWDTIKRPLVSEFEFAPVADKPSVFRAPTSFLPLAATVLMVTLPEPALWCELSLADDLPGAVAFATRRAENGSPLRTFWFDLSVPLAPLVLRGIEKPWPDFVLATPDGMVSAKAIVRAQADAETLLLPRLAGAAIEFRELAQRLPIPIVKAKATLYFLLPTTVVSMPYQQGAALTWPPAVMREFEFARELLGSFVVHFCWRTDAGAMPPQRSKLDWFVLY